ASRTRSAARSCRAISARIRARSRALSSSPDLQVVRRISGRSFGPRVTRAYARPLRHRTDPVAKRGTYLPYIARAPATRRPASELVEQTIRVVELLLGLLEGLGVDFVEE